jgi:hypothetical protein
MSGPATAHGTIVGNDDTHSSPSSGDEAAFPIAQRLSQTTLHPLNVSPDLLTRARQLADETGIAADLLLAILWQEQQWTQNQRGILGHLERKAWDLAEEAASRTVDPTISLGITHMKPPTARMVIRHFGLAAAGLPLSTLDDGELAELVAQNDEVDIMLTAYYLKYLRQEEPPGESPGLGAATDEDLFILYAADTAQVREYNALYGSSTAHRSGDILPRMRDYNAFTQWLADTRAWEALTFAQRRQALEQLAATTQAGERIVLKTPYPLPDSIQIHVTGTGSAPGAE